MTENIDLHDVPLDDIQSGSTEDASHKSNDASDPSCLYGIICRKSFYNLFRKNEAGTHWNRKLEYYLSAIGYVVGIGNLWRFPYLMYKNGGGAFFIPYIIMVIFISIPMTLLEIGLGQFTRQGVLTCWSFAWFFKGLGIASLIYNIYLAIYYIFIVVWAIYYFFISLGSPVAWQTCGSWSSELCRDRLATNVTSAQDCLNKPNIIVDTVRGICNNTATNRIYAIYDTNLAMKYNIKPKFATEDFKSYVALQDGFSNGIENMGILRWDMVLILLCVWIFLTICMRRGIDLTGKIVYVTVLFPYLALIIFLIMSSTLSGYQIGYDAYLRPNTTRLLDGSVWKDAAAQITFSTSVAQGGLLTLSAFNNFHNDVLVDTLVIQLIDLLTSFLSGFVVFGFLGHFSYVTNSSLTDIVESGTALVFVVYPEALKAVPASVFFVLLFFVLIFTLGIDSQLVILEIVITGITDQFLFFSRRHNIKLKFIPKNSNIRRRYEVSGESCINYAKLLYFLVLFLLGLPLCTQGGPYLLQVMDDYCGSWNLLIICLEALAIGYVYGAIRFTNDIAIMMPYNPVTLNTHMSATENAAATSNNGLLRLYYAITCCCLPWRYIKWFFIICWCLITPIITLAIFIYSWIDFEPSKYAGQTLPMINNIIGGLMSASIFISIIIPMIILPIHVPSKTLYNKFTKLFSPTVYWGPPDIESRALVAYYDRNMIIDPQLYISNQLNIASSNHNNNKDQTLSRQQICNLNINAIKY